MLKNCEDCEYSIFYEGFEKDPICKIASGILCKSENTSNFKPRSSPIILKKGGALALLIEALSIDEPE